MISWLWVWKVTKVSIDERILWSSSIMRATLNVASLETTGQICYWIETNSSFLQTKSSKTYSSILKIDPDKNIFMSPFIVLYWTNRFWNYFQFLEKITHNFPGLILILKVELISSGLRHTTQIYKCKTNLIFKLLKHRYCFQSDEFGFKHDSTFSIQSQTFSDGLKTKLAGHGIWCFRSPSHM